MSETTWRYELRAAMEEASDPGPIVAVAPSEDVLDAVFDDGYGSAEGPEILIWTELRVYFPVVYDGAEWLDSAPRHPQLKGQPHIGGP